LAKCPLFPPNGRKWSILKESNKRTPFMRKIETQMIAAINNRKDWKSGNTEVFINGNNCANVYLHGNLIAWVNKDNGLTVFDGGWQTNTTKSRLNALCDEFCLRGECIFQKDFAWYVRKLVGAVNGQSVYQTEGFFSGYAFNWGVNPPSFLLPNQPTIWKQSH